MLRGQRAPWHRLGAEVALVPLPVPTGMRRRAGEQGFIHWETSEGGSEKAEIESEAAGGRTEGAGAA